MQQYGSNPQRLLTAKAPRRPYGGGMQAPQYPAQPQAPQQAMPQQQPYGGLAVSSPRMQMAPEPMGTPYGAPAISEVSTQPGMAQSRMPQQRRRMPYGGAPITSMDSGPAY